MRAYRPLIRSKPIGGVEADQIGKGVPFEHPRIDLPLIAAQREVRAFAVGVGQDGVELRGRRCGSIAVRRPAVHRLRR